MLNAPLNFQTLARNIDGPVRPPWSVNESLFLELCTQCSDCIDACQRNIIIEGRGKYPEIDFSKGGCYYCGDCVQACQHGGLSPSTDNPWNLAAFITQNCVTTQGIACSDCADECEAHAINIRLSVNSPPVPVLNQRLCTGCGQCVSVCGADAIVMLTTIHEGGMTS
ncbi:MAG: ferredoxin-type protein NapF [Gammaproteobacteria bacterium]